MTYKIYEIKSADRLDEIDRYSHGRVEKSYILKEMNFYGYDEISSKKEAVAVIRKNLEICKFKRLTILPIIDVAYDGTLNIDNE